MSNNYQPTGKPYEDFKAVYKALLNVAANLSCLKSEQVDCMPPDCGECPICKARQVAFPVVKWVKACYFLNPEEQSDSDDINKVLSDANRRRRNIKIED